MVLERCQFHGIKLSKKKFAVGTSVKFAGFVVSEDGIKPDPDKLAAVRNFPAPKNVSELRSFLGLVNQLGAFVPDLAHMTVKIRTLLKKRNAFVWLDQHNQEFEAAKALLCSVLF